MPGLEIPTVEPIFKPQTTGLDRAMGLMSKSQGAAGAMQPNIPAPEKSIGGGLTAGLSGAGAGAAIGGAMTTAGTAAATGAASGSAAGPWGAAIGSAVGIAGYYLS